MNEVISDVEAVLKSYVGVEREVLEKTRDLLHRIGRGRPERPSRRVSEGLVRLAPSLRVAG